MKFGKNLLRVAEISDPAWGPYWVNYKALKKMIKHLPGDQSSSADRSVSEDGDDSRNDEDSSSAKDNKCGGGSEVDALVQNPTEVAFFRFLHAELRKSVRFFDRISEEYSIRVDRLHEGFDIMQRPDSVLVHDRWLYLARSAFKVYRDLLLLETYAIMTYCAFSKILKKHDKMTGHNTRTAFMSSMVSKANFTVTIQLQEMIRGSLQRYNEASECLELAGRTNLQEDERLFLGMVMQLNNDVLIVADEEEAPMAGDLHSQILENSKTTTVLQGSQSRRPLGMDERGCKKRKHCD